MSVLEELWYGNLEPSEFDSSPGKEYKELLHLVSRKEEKLLATMTVELKELFSRYPDSVREFQALAECLLYIKDGLLLQSLALLPRDDIGEFPKSPPRSLQRGCG